MSGCRVEPMRMLSSGYVIVPVTGELDIAGREATDAAFSSAAEQARTGVVADLTRLTFIDGSGLGMLIRAHQRSGHLPAGLRLAGPAARVERLLRLTHLDSYLSVYPTVSEAVRGGPT